MTTRQHRHRLLSRPRLLIKHRLPVLGSFVKLGSLGNDPLLEKKTAVDIAKTVTVKLDELSDSGKTAIAFSSIILRHDLTQRDTSTTSVHELIRHTNDIIHTHCQKNDYTFIDNDNIQKDDLFDGVHCNESGATKLAKNMARAIRGEEQRTHDPATQFGQYTKVNFERIGVRPSAARRRPRNVLGDYWPQYNNTLRPQMRPVPSMKPTSFPVAGPSHAYGGHRY